MDEKLDYRVGQTFRANNNFNNDGTTVDRDLNDSDRNDKENRIATESENDGSSVMQTVELWTGQDVKVKTNDTKMQQTQEEEEYVYDGSYDEVVKY